MNTIGFDSLKDRDYKGSQTSGKASVSEDDVNAFSQMLERKTSDKDSVKESSREAIYSDKEEKKEADKNARNASSLQGKAKLSASKQMLYTMAYVNRATLSLSQKSSMGLNADGASKAMLMHSSPNAGLASKAAASPAASQPRGAAASSALKADELSGKAGRESSRTGATGINANVAAQNIQEQGQIALKAADKAEKADAARNVKREEVIKQIIQHVELRNFAGKSELTIKMNPEFLGAMKMRLIFEGDKVSAEFNTTSQAVREAIQESTEELSGAFKEKGIKVGKIRVKLVDEKLQA